MAERESYLSKELCVPVDCFRSLFSKVITTSAIYLLGRAFSPFFFLSLVSDYSLVYLPLFVYDGGTNR